MKKNILILLALLFSLVLVGQNSDRKKIGLVLSGGGAKGLAHIGVLKVLEESGVHIDYIAGTSMGAIVGGLYASGYSAKELDSIFSTVDAEALIQDYVPRTSKSFYEKRNDEIYALQLPFDDFKIGTPTALSKGMYNYNLLSRLLAHVRHLRDFNQLSIPFVCIATDLETGKGVLLDKGNLAQCILASGAFPSLYSPVEINGKILIDGGIADNYPLDEVRKMGADIVIGVDVQDGLKSLDEIKGFSDVLLQISNYSMVGDMERKKKETDFYIKPNIKGFSVVSFTEGDEIIKRGVEAANVFLDDFKRIGTPASEGQPHHVKPKFQDKLLVSQIEINHLDDYTKNYIFGKLKLRPCELVTFEEFASGIDNLNGTQNFSGFSYAFEADPNDEDADILNLKLTEGKTKRYLKFGLHFDNFYKSAALVNVTQKKMFFKNDVGSLDFGVGDNFRYNFNYYVDNGYLWSVGVSSRLNKFQRTINYPITSDYVDIQEMPPSLSVNYLDLTNRLYFQTFYKERFLIGVGLEHKYNQIDIRNLILKKPWLDKSHYLSAYANVIYDTYDNKYFPRKGVLLNAEYKNYFHSSDYNNYFDNFSQITAELGTVKTFFNRLSVEVKGDMGVTIGSESSTFLRYFLGGYGFQSVYNIKPFYGYDFLSVFDDSFIKVLFRLDFEIFNKHHVNFSGNYAQIGKGIFQYSDWLSKPQYNGYAFGYGYQTLIGPIEFKHSWSPDTKNHYSWFSIGFWF